MSLKKEILKNLGLNEAKIDFEEKDVLKVRAKFDDIGERIEALRDEVKEVLDESNRFRTDKGDFLIKGQNDYVRAYQALDKAMMNIRKGSFKGLGRMPKGEPGTFYGDRGEE